MKRNRELADLGSTTALNAMVEIVSGSRRGTNPAILAREVRQLLKLGEGRSLAAIEGFCAELQEFIEVAPRDPSASLIEHIATKRTRRA